MSIQLGNCQAVSGADTTTTSGDLSAHAIRTAYRTGSDTLSNNRLVESGSGSLPAYTDTLNKLNASIVYTPSAMTIRLDADVASSDFGNKQLQLRTLSNFVQAYSSAYPASGSAKATGASGRSVTVQALNPVQVRVSADLNGGGVADNTSDMNWADIVN